MPQAGCRAGPRPQRRGVLRNHALGEALRERPPQRPGPSSATACKPEEPLRLQNHASLKGGEPKSLQSGKVCSRVGDVPCTSSEVPDYANYNTNTMLCPRKNRSPSQIKKTGISIQQVAAMLRSHFSSFNMQLLPENREHFPKHTRRK